MYSLIILLFLMVTQVQAESRAGNGGVGVMCPGQKFRLLDYFEGERSSRERLTDVTSPSSYYGHLQILLDRLAKFDPELALALKRRLKTLHVKLVSLHPDPIQDYQSAVSYHCVRFQLAVQYYNNSTGFSEFEVDRARFAALSGTDQAGLILHELLYEHAIREFGANNSDAIRPLVFALGSTQFYRLNKHTFQQMYARLLP